MKDESYNTHDNIRSSILNEHNRLRADPIAYIPFLQKYLKYIKEDNILYLPGNSPLQLKEGAQSFIDAIEFLKRQNPVLTLTFDERLTNAAQEFSEYLGNNGLIGNVNKENLGVVDRIEKYCEWDNACAENIDYGSRTAQDTIISLLVDDGVMHKGHRENLFSKELKYIGIGVSTHRDYNSIVVIDYVGGIRNKGVPYFDYCNFKYDYPKGVNAGLDRISKKERKYKNALQLKDDDAPDKAINCKVVKKLTEVTEEFRKVRKIIRKIYDLEDGTQHIVEIEDI